MIAQGNALGLSFKNISSPERAADVSPTRKRFGKFRPMLTTLIEMFRDSDTHHRLSLFDQLALKVIEAMLFEKNGKPYHLSGFQPSRKFSGTSRTFSSASISVNQRFRLCVLCVLLRRLIFGQDRADDGVLQLRHERPHADLPHRMTLQKIAKPLRENRGGFFIWPVSGRLPE